MGVITKAVIIQNTLRKRMGAETTCLGVMEVITKTVITRTTQGKNGGRNKLSGSDGSNCQNCITPTSQESNGGQTQPFWE